MTARRLDAYTAGGLAFDDRYRLSAHAVITDADNRVLLLRATYGDRGWGLPGGAVDPGETLHDTLVRECEEELGVAPVVLYLSGIYLHRSIDAHAAIFRCALLDGAVIRLSSEHSAYAYEPLESLSPVQRTRVRECLSFDGRVRTARF